MRSHPSVMGIVLEYALAVDAWALWGVLQGEVVLGWVELGSTQSHVVDPQMRSPGAGFARHVDIAFGRLRFRREAVEFQLFFFSLSPTRLAFHLVIPFPSLRLGLFAFVYSLSGWPWEPEMEECLQLPPYPPSILTRSRRDNAVEPSKLSARSCASI